MKKTAQISESLGLGILLALAGGFMDAYSYVCRGHVFANAQTGNIVLIGVSLSEGRWPAALRYVFPVAAFAAGIAAADVIRYRLNAQRLFHWRQITVLFELVVFSFVAFIPAAYNPAANGLLSFACGLQVESFRKINGTAAATTMCIGNLRTAIQALVAYRHEKDRRSLEKGLQFFCIITFFVLGAVLGNRCVRYFGIHAILAAAVFLAAAFVLMFIDREQGA